MEAARSYLSLFTQTHPQAHMEGKMNTEDNTPEAGWEGQTPSCTPCFHSLVLTACAPSRPSEAAPVLRIDPSAVLLQAGTSGPPLVPPQPRSLGSGTGALGLL